MIELSRYYGDNRETRVYRSNNSFFIELYVDNILVEGRTLPSDRTFNELSAYAGDYAEDWATGDIQ